MKKGVLIGMCLWFVAATAWSGSHLSPALQHDRLGYEYLYPLPNTVTADPQTTIILRDGRVLEAVTSALVSLVDVIGDRSGPHSGRLVRSSDNETLIFKPDVAFEPGERVTVRVHDGIPTMDGSLPAIEYSFSVSDQPLTEPQRRMLRAKHYEDAFGISLARLDSPPLPPFERSSRELDEMLLPPDFPPWTVDINETNHGGYVYLAPKLVRNGSRWSYLLIVDNEGVPQFFRKQANSVLLDLKLQPSGHITYHQYPPYDYYVMDQTYTVVDTVIALNGLGTDGHDMHIFENGHVMLITVDWEIVDMSDEVEGGNEEAVVKVGGIQEIDADGNVIFNWLGLDYLPVTDAAPEVVDLTDVDIDYMHSNSVEVDADNNLLLSNRNLFEATKIDRETGDVIWRLGGGAGNQFTFIGDEPVDFTMQHDVRRDSDGNLTVFDNGNFHDTRATYIRTYALDEENLEATLLWRYTREDGDRLPFSATQGNSQPLADGGFFIGWGPPAYDSVLVSEITDDGTITWQMSTHNTEQYDYIPHTYRAFRCDTPGVAAKPDLQLYQNGELGDVYMYYFGHTADQFHVYADMYYPPNTLRGSTEDNLFSFDGMAIGETWFFTIRAQLPDGTLSPFSAIQSLTLQQDMVKEEPGAAPSDFLLIDTHPNPFNSRARITVTTPRTGWLTVQIYDVLGRLVTTLLEEEPVMGAKTVLFDGSLHASGVYWVHVQHENGLNVTQKLTLVK